MKLAIVKGVPIPEMLYGRPDKYPWKDMEPGDSFVLPNYTADLQRNVLRSAHYKGIKVTTRKEGTALRVWRV